MEEKKNETARKGKTGRKGEEKGRSEFFRNINTEVGGLKGRFCIDHAGPDQSHQGGSGTLILGEGSDEEKDAAP